MPAHEVHRAHDGDGGGSLAHDGCTFAYRVQGSGTPVVLIQGVGLHGDGWAPQVDELSEAFACLTFDHRGMGASQPAGGAVTVERLAGDVLALMDAQGWDSAHLIGHSLGALVALEVAATAPARARSLALLCCVVRGRDATRVTWPIARLGIAATFGSARARRHAFLRLVLPPNALRGADLDALAADLAPRFGHDLAEQPDVVDAQLAALRRYDARPRIVRLPAVPALVVSAEHDPIAPPRFGRDLAAALPGARFVRVPDAAHGVTIQRAREVNALLHEHLGSA
jgi:pimeloyl-ACP methyl ester carboxylesterase